MVRRWPALLVISALFVAAGILNRGHSERQASIRAKGRVRLDEVIAAPLAVAAPVGALSSTWFCAAGTATKGGAADMMVAIANPGRRPLTAEVTVVPESGPSRTRQLVAPPHGRVRLPLRSVVTARYAAALVEVRGGSVSVDREVTGPDGYEASPCAASSSDRWYFAAGSTLRGADEYLALFNPYPDDTSVDMTFATEQGSRAPRRLQGFPVPGRSLRVIHLNAERVNRHSLIAAQVVARSGRLVVDRLQLFDGSGDPVGSRGGVDQTVPPHGLAVSSGVTRPVGSWAFPAAGKIPGEREQIAVSNPSDRDSEVDIGVTLDDPLRNGRLDPFPLTVPAHSVKTLDITDQATVPDKVGHSLTVRSTNGVDVVAERILTGGTPWRRLGVTMGPGSPLEATTWLFAAGGVTSDTTEQIVVQNLSGRSTTVDVTVLGGRMPVTDPGLRNIDVPGGGRTTIVLDRLRSSSLPVQVHASQPVVVERAIYRAGQPGISISPGVPLPGGARYLQRR